MTAKIFNANDILSGRVVYLTADGGWSERIGDAAIAQSAEDEARLQTVADAAFEARRVVDVYPVDVTIDGGQIRPLVYRERIRAEGPSVRPHPANLAPNG